MPKTTHTATGASEQVGSSRTVTYYADFSGGAGSAQLQVNISGDWLPADDAVSATMATAEVCESSRFLRYRWNVTVNSGSIVTYLEGDTV